MTEAEDLVEDLTWIRQRVRNCRGAIESGQMSDKDVHGGLLRVMDRLDDLITRLRAPPLDAGMLTDDKLAGWARNWHWQDCAEDKPVDPSIYFRDKRMLKAFVAEFGSPVSRPHSHPPEK